jgi:LPXTG-site transpeptidase (sortase) family protein
VLALALVFVVVYLALNATATYNSVKFSLDPESFKDDKLLGIVDATGDPNNLSANQSQIIENNLPDSWLSYPRLGIKAPIFWDVPTEIATEKLADGLVHIANTSRPGDGGESLISGHSSYYWWQEGDYKEVFVNLPKAEIGDRIIIRRGSIYIYTVTNKYQVGGGEGLTFETAGEEKLSLMTCVPLGTNLRRLIVEAKLESSF